MLAKSNGGSATLGGTGMGQLLFREGRSVVFEWMAEGQEDGGVDDDLGNGSVHWSAFAAGCRTDGDGDRNGDENVAAAVDAIDTGADA